MNATELITKRIKGTSDWRGEFMSRLGKLIHKADPEITEELKWNTPVFTHGGMVCGVAAFKAHVGTNFFKGASLKDPGNLFNSSLDAKAMRTLQRRQYQ